MTPHELNLQIEAYTDRMKLESEERITQAYATALWQRVKRMPNLSDIIKRQDPKKMQSDAQILATIKELNKRMGGHVKRG